MSAFWMLVAILAVVLGVIIVGLVALVLLQRRDPANWRVMAVLEFVCSPSPDQMRARLLSVAQQQRGWRLQPSASDDLVVIRCRPTLLTWTKQISAALTAEGTGTRVALSCAVPQLWDWGESHRAVATLRTAVAS